MILNLPGFLYGCSPLVVQNLHWMVSALCCLPYMQFVPLQTNVREIDTYPNMEYTDSRNRVFTYKSDIVDSIVRACARK